MSDESDEPDEDREPTQETPTGHEIPIPNKSEWDQLLGKVAKGAGSNGADHKKGDPPK